MSVTGSKTASAAMLAIALGTVGAHAQAPSFAMKEQAGVRWVCGGIGLDEREALARLESESNLKLVFAGGERSAYVAEVGVSLSERSGKVKSVQFKADGPICLLQAPAGSYRVEASYGDAKQAVVTAVGKEAKRPGMLVFRFPEEH